MLPAISAAPRLAAAGLGISLLPLLLAAPGRAMSLNQACATFATKLASAQASGDSARIQQVYAEGSQRIAKHFNGATCPDVKAP